MTTKEATLAMRVLKELLRSKRHLSLRERAAVEEAVEILRTLEANGVLSRPSVTRLLEEAVAAPEKWPFILANVICELEEAAEKYSHDKRAIDLYAEGLLLRTAIPHKKPAVLRENLHWYTAMLSLYERICAGGFAAPPPSASPTRLELFWEEVSKGDTISMAHRIHYNSSFIVTHSPPLQRVLLSALETPELSDPLLLSTVLYTLLQCEHSFFFKNELCFTQTLCFEFFASRALLMRALDTIGLENTLRLTKVIYSSDEEPTILVLLDYIENFSTYGEMPISWWLPLLSSEASANPEELKIL